MTCMVAGRSFGDILRSCRLLQQQRRFTQCTAQLTTMITALEEQAESLPRAQIVSQNELLSLAYNGCGGVLYLMVDYTEAVDDFTRALSYNPCMASAHHNRALIHYRMGRFDDAIADLEKALQLNGNYEDAKQSLQIVRKESELARAKQSEDDQDETALKATRMKDSHEANVENTAIGVHTEHEHVGHSIKLDELPQKSGTLLEREESIKNKHEIDASEEAIRSVSYKPG